VPTDYVRGAVESQAGATIEWSLPEELGRQLKELSRKEGVTLFMALLAGFQLLLSRYTGQQDIAVGSPIAGRTRTDTDNLIGFLREHAGVAEPDERDDELPGLAGAGAGEDAGSVRTPGGAVRKAGGRAATGARSEPSAVVPGHVLVSEYAVQ